MGAVAVGAVDGDVEAAWWTTCWERRAATVAELGPYRHGDQPTDAVSGLDQRPARRRW